MTTLSVPPYESSLEATILYLPCRSQRKLMQLHLLTQQVIKYRLLLVTKLDLIVTKLILSLCKILFPFRDPSNEKQALTQVILFSSTCADESSA